MKIVAVDLATRTGWCVARAGKPVRVGTHNLYPYRANVGRFLNAHMKFMGKVLQRGDVDLVAFESPLLRTQTNLATLRKLYGLAGVTEMVARSHGVRTWEVGATTAKKMLTGNGRAEKQDMIKEANRRGVDVPDDNAADAFAVFLCAVKQHAPSALAFYEAKGTLV